MRYGGGSHPEVELFLSERLKVPWSTDDIPVTADGLKIGPVRLLLETEDAITITRSADKDAPGFLVSSPAYAISKESIVACRFIPRIAEEKISRAVRDQSKHTSVATVGKPKKEASGRPILPSPAATMETPSTAANAPRTTKKPQARRWHDNDMGAGRAADAAGPAPSSNRSPQIGKRKPEIKSQ
jgi:hypothetical protein